MHRQMFKTERNTTMPRPVGHVVEGCPIHPICIGSPKWWRSVTDRDGSAAFVSSRHVVGSLRSGRMVTSVAVCSQEKKNIHGVVMEWVVNFGASSRSGRIVTSRHIRDGWFRVAPFVFSPGSYEMVMAVLWCEVKMSADRPVRDGWQRPVTTLTDGVDPFPFVCSQHSWGVVE